MLSQSILASLAWTALVASYGASASGVKIDFQRRTSSIPDLHKRDHVQADLPEAGGIAYLMNISLGTPPQQFFIQFDTGSSNTWVQTPDTAYCQIAAHQCNQIGTFDYSASSTFQEISGGFAVQYGTGAAQGDYVNDTLLVGDISVPGFTFGLATQVAADNAAFGIVGAGFASLEVLAQSAGIEYPTLLDSLYNAGKIDRRAFSVYLDDQEAQGGTVLFGGIDPSKYTGDLTSFSIAPNQTGLYDRYRLDMTQVSFIDESGSTTQLSASGMSAPAILDTGASLLVLPKTVVDQIVTGLGAVPYSSIYLVDCKYRASNASLAIQLGGQNGAEYQIPVNQLIGDPGIMGTFPDGAQACKLSIEGLDEGDLNVAALGGFTLGDPFLRNLYVVYDIDAGQISLAQANYNQTGQGNIANIPSGSVGISQAATVVSATPTFISIPYSLTGAVTGTAVASGTSAAGTGTAITENPGTPTFSLATAAASGSSGSSGSGSGNAASSIDVPVSWTFALGLVTLGLAVFL